MNDSDNNFRDELYRLNCVEINSESDSKYKEHSILFVDDVLEEDKMQEYEDYVLYGRDGMPVWKDYYSIKNLVETLQEIDEVKNIRAVDVIKEVEESFIKTLFSRILVEKSVLTRSIKSILFSILQKLESFYYEDDALLCYLLKIENREISNNDIVEANLQYETIFIEEQYFTNDEKLFIEICLSYFTPEKKNTYNKIINDSEDESIVDTLPDILSKVKVTKED